MVYNDFIVLYCCELEYYTHLEIIKRAETYENLRIDLTERDNSTNKKEENNKEKMVELSIQ